MSQAGTWAVRLVTVIYGKGPAQQPVPEKAPGGMSAP